MYDFGITRLYFLQVRLCILILHHTRGNVELPCKSGFDVNEHPKATHRKRRTIQQEQGMIRNLHVKRQWLAQRKRRKTRPGPRSIRSVVPSPTEHHRWQAPSEHAAHKVVQALETPVCYGAGVAGESVDAALEDDV
ncbi:hypothetical protein C0995_003435, partial [Termitomyces sp. Mi166